MTLQLEELLVKKKEPVQILDLTKSIASSKDELRKLLERVPEFKIKIEKVKLEEIKLKQKFIFRIPRREFKKKTRLFTNPVPSEMKSLRMDDLCSVGIQWKMLTSLRPKTKPDEEYYSKLIEIGKLQIATREYERKTPLLSYLRKTKNRVGIIETKFVRCRACGEEFCTTDVCSTFAYDSFERVTVAEILSQEEGTALTTTAADDDGTSKRKFVVKRRKKIKTKKSVLFREKLSKLRKSSGEIARKTVVPGDVINVKNIAGTVSSKSGVNKVPNAARTTGAKLKSMALGIPKKELKTRIKTRENKRKT